MSCDNFVLHEHCRNVDVCKCHFDQNIIYAWHSVLLLLFPYMRDPTQWMVKIFKADFKLVSAECATPIFYFHFAPSKTIAAAAVPFDLHQKIHLLCFWVNGSQYAHTDLFVVLWVYSFCVGAYMRRVVFRCTWAQRTTKHGNFQFKMYVLFIPCIWHQHAHCLNLLYLCEMRACCTVCAL